MSSSIDQEKIPVAVLAATGSVGQRFVQLLDGHPWFEVVALTGSDGKAGRLYAEACHWVLTDPMPAWAAEMALRLSVSSEIPARVIFSALPSQAARQIEPEFAAAGRYVFSNASAFRAEEDVPLLMPEVNPDHLSLVSVQQAQRGWEGFIVTNPNCTSAGLTVALKALQTAFGLRRAFVVSLQALSGAGYPGVASLDVIDNVIPYISGEEEKVEQEPRKMLGALTNGAIAYEPLEISAHTNRVAVSDGHLVCLSVQLGRAATEEAAATALAGYEGPSMSEGLPSSPDPIISVAAEPDRPQPRLDRMTGKGMTTVVGRLRKDPLLDLKMVVLSHNTIRGAAGGSIFNAELALKHGFIPTG